MSKIFNDSLAKIAISKNLIKEYNTPDCERTVYLNNGTEFQIYLKNPNPYHVGIKIYLNDKYIGNTLVLKPGQSFWLDRYLDNDSKFLFSTYNVEDSAEMKYATSKNGKIKIEFYKEREFTQTISKTITNIPDFDVNKVTLLDSCYNSNDIVYNSSYPFATKTVTCTGSATSVNTNSYSRKLCSAKVDTSEYDRSATKAITNSTIETGRIEKGSKSDQKFADCDVQFDYLPFKTEYMTILPRSRKQVHTSEVKRKYCSQCGSKVSPKDKFCSNCGHKL